MSKKVRIGIIIFLACLLLGICALLIVKYPNKTEAQPVINTEIVEEPKDELVLTMVGDNLIHGPIYRAAKKEGHYDFSMLFQNVKDEIQESDLAIINQETILVSEPNRYSSYPTFGTPTDIGHAIVDAGFDVVAHATNHTNDKGVTGINDTLNFWKENYPEIAVLGIHQDELESDIKYVEKNNIKIAFVNYTYGLNGLELPTSKKYMVDVLGNKEEIAKTLKEAKENSDILIPILHIGTEYVYNPSTYHKNYVEFFIDNGADVVLCAHPHVLEPYGMVTTKNNNTALVYYSLGNFASNQHEMPRMLGGMAKIKLVKEDEEVKIESYDLIPLVTHFEDGFFTTYKLEDYTEELASIHGIKQYCEFSLEKVKELYQQIIEMDI